MKRHFPQTSTLLSLWIWYLAVNMCFHRGQNQVRVRNPTEELSVRGGCPWRWRPLRLWLALPSANTHHHTSFQFGGHELQPSLKGKLDEETLPSCDPLPAPQRLQQGWNVGEDHANPTSHRALRKCRATKIIILMLLGMLRLRLAGAR